MDHLPTTKLEDLDLPDVDLQGGAKRRRGKSRARKSRRASRKHRVSFVTKDGRRVSFMSRSRK